MTEKILRALRRRYTLPEWILVSEIAIYPFGPRLDAWAISTWAQQETIGFEIKTSRADFKRDTKWQDYLTRCDRFYFVTPANLIDQHEIPPHAGLITWKPESGLRTVRKSPIIRTPETVLPRPFLALTMRALLLTDPPFNPYRGQNGRAV